MMLPGFGIVSEVISTMSRKPIFGYRLMALSLIGDRRARLLGLGAPHVRRRHVHLAARADDDHDAADRGPDRDQDLLLARDAVGGRDPPHDADAVRARLHRHVHDRRHLRDLARRRCRSTSTSPTPTSSSRTSTSCSSAARCSRSSPAIYYWFPKMTGRMYDETAREAPLLAHVRRLQRHLLPDALDRDAGDAAPRRRLRRPTSATGTCSSRSRRSCSAPSSSSSSTT